MIHRRIHLIASCLVFIATSLSSSFLAGQEASPRNVGEWFDSRGAGFAEIYRWLHSHPEVSFQEGQTAAKLAGIWRELGFEVTTGVGGHGIVGVMKNGDGPTLMLRCDLDALPVTEQTPLPFASKKTVTLANGSSAGVMHACGHDLHMTNLTATATFLAEHKADWSGTLMLVGQPAEERGAGARAMLQDGLFERFPRPDFAVALHVAHDKPAGQVGVLAGYALANVDSVDIHIKGRGGHGSAPHTTIDPIVQAADLVMSLQTIVSREVDPQAPAVVTVGAIQGGTKHNIIGNSCHLQLTVRSYSDQVRQKLLSGIRRKAKAIAEAYAAEEPEVTVSEGTPSLKNDAELTARLRTAFEDAIGADQVFTSEPSMGGEDFSQYGRAGVPILMYRLGSVSEERLDRFKKLGVQPPSLHSSSYYPDLQPALKTGVMTMVAGALELLQQR